MWHPFFYENYQISQVILISIQYDPNRQLSQFLQLPQWQLLVGRVTQFEKQNERQEREINQLQRRLQRVNQRLRAVEKRLQIPFTPFEGEY